MSDDVMIFRWRHDFPMTSWLSDDVMIVWWHNLILMSVPMYFPYYNFLKIMSFTDTTDLKPFSNSKILKLKCDGYDDNAIGHVRKLEKS